jgi:uncharacterized membrane protein
MIWLLYAAAALHAFFMACEWWPWRLPVLLRIASRKLPSGQSFTPAQQALVATIVHNAGIYNAVIAGGLLWAAVSGDAGRETARVLLAGAAAAGIFGTLTLKSPLTAVQAIIGLVGVLFV